MGKGSGAFQGQLGIISFVSLGPSPPKRPNADARCPALEPRGGLRDGACARRAGGPQTVGVKKTWPLELFHYFKKLLSGEEAKAGTKVAQKGVHYSNSGRWSQQEPRVPDLCPPGLLRLQDQRPQEERTALSV